MPENGQLRSVVADVRLSEHLDAVFVTPRSRESSSTAMQILRDVLPDIPLKRTPNGIAIRPLVAAGLRPDPQGLSLRWSAEAEQLVKNRLRATREHAGLLQKLADIRTGGADEARSLLSDIRGLDVLDDHQLVNVASMTLPAGFGLCVFDEQGAGKTVTAIFAYDVLVSRDEADFVLIVAPKSMVPEWANDFARFKGDLYKVVTMIGTRREKMAALRSKPDVVVTNFETAVRLENELRSALRRRDGRALLIVDESFFIKNLDAKRTKSLRRLREWCGRAFVLCGTPAPNAPSDLIQQFNLVDFGITFDGVDVPDDRDAALLVIRSAFEERGLYTRHLKANVLPNLPAKRFQRVFVELQPDQHRLYEAALKDLILDLQSIDDALFRRQLTSYFAKRHALLQLCSAPEAVVEGYEEVPAKRLALDDILKELIEERGEKVVLWSFYTASIVALTERYAQYCPVRYDGSVTKVSDRRDAVRRFQEDDSTMLFIGNPAAAGAGLTLHRARYAIYESLSNQAAHYLQSLDRIHRRGQDRNVEYIILLCDRTLECDEYERLISKERAAQTLLGDQVEPPVTRVTMLKEAVHALRQLEGRTHGNSRSLEVENMGQRGSKP